MVEWGIYTGADDGSWVIAPPAVAGRIRASIAGEYTAVWFFANGTRGFHALGRTSVWLRDWIALMTCSGAGAENSRPHCTRSRD